MPTGLTQRVKDGEITDLNGFAWTCARQFGALITMRDSPQGAEIKIPEKFEPDEDSYYQSELPKAEARVEELDAMTIDEAQVSMDLADEVAKDRHAKWDAEKEETRERYEAMLEKVNAWEAPEELAGLKKVMIEQLEGSIQHDCSSYDWTQAVQTGAQWLESERQRARDNVERLKKNIEEERERGEGRLKWLHALVAEVGAPPAPEGQNG